MGRSDVFSWPLLFYHAVSVSSKNYHYMKNYSRIKIALLFRPGWPNLKPWKRISDHWRETLIENATIQDIIKLALKDFQSYITNHIKVNSARNRAISEPAAKKLQQTRSADWKPIATTSTATSLERIGFHPIGCYPGSRNPAQTMKRYFNQKRDSGYGSDTDMLHTRYSSVKVIFDGQMCLSKCTKLFRKCYNCWIERKFQN